MTPTPAGPDALVNTGVSDDQYGAQAAVLANGVRMVVWNTIDSASGDGDGTGVMGRLFGADGAPLGDDIIVSSPSAGDQYNADVIALVDGSFLATWFSDADGLNHAQVFSSSGAAAGSPIAIYLPAGGGVSVPETAAFTALASGGFAASYVYSVTPPGSPTPLFAVVTQQYGADGEAAGDPIFVGDYSSDIYRSLSVVANATSIATAWTENHPDGATTLHLSIADTNGTLLGQAVIDDQPYQSLSPAIAALTNGNFVVAWSSNTTGEATPDYSVHGQVFDAAGEPVGSSFLISTTTADTAVSIPSVAVLPDGRFAVTWAAELPENATTSGADIYVRAFDASGTALGDAVRVNSTTADFQDEPQIAVLDSGHLLVTWDSMESGEGGSNSIDIRDITLEVPPPACFLAGTMILTDTGERAVETLVPGDRVVTADGRALPVKFIGCQTLAARFVDAAIYHPVLIAAGALGHGLPARDLYTSPGHAMLLGGVLVIAGALRNGLTIRTMDHVPERYTYFHIELDEHAVIFAEGAATETYCDNLPREVFDNHAEYTALYPAASPIRQLDLPTVKSKRQLPALLRRALAMAAAGRGAVAEAA